MCFKPFGNFWHDMHKTRSIKKWFSQSDWPAQNPLTTSDTSLGWIVPKLFPTSLKLSWEQISATRLQNSWMLLQQHAILSPIVLELDVQQSHVGVICRSVYQLLCQTKQSWAKTELFKRWHKHMNSRFHCAQFLAMNHPMQSWALSSGFHYNFI